MLIYVLVIFLYANFKKIDLFDSFSNGIKKTFSVLPNLFINIFMILLAINVFLKSEIIDLILSFFNFREDIKLILMQILLKPISWNSSLIMMNTILNQYGVDSNIGIFSSLIQASCDTTFYITFLYLSHVKIKNSSHIILTSILSVFLTFIFCYILSRLFVKL